MTETGTVIGSSGKTLKIRLGAMDACAGCLNSECKQDGGTIDAANPDDLELNEGDTVMVSIKASRAAGDALIVFLLPITLFVAAFLGSGALFPAGGEGLSILSGFVGLVVGGVASVMIKRGIKFNDLPHVIKKHETSPESTGDTGVEVEGNGPF